MRTVLLILIVCLASCKSQKPIVADETIERDSISTVTRIVPRDTIIPVAADSVSISIPIAKITEKPQEHTSKSGRTKALVSREADNINIECIFTELELRLQILDRELRIFSERSKIRVITKKVEVPYTPWYKETLAWIGGIFLALLIGSLLLKTIKP